MIFCETGGADSTAFDTLAVFVSQARGCGLPAVISERSIPASLRAAHEFDVAPFLASADPTINDQFIVLAAEKVDQERASHLREVSKGQPIASMMFGDFPTRQSEITISSRLAYALNREPELIAMDQNGVLPVKDLPIFSALSHAKPRDKPTVGLFFPDLAGVDTRSAIRALNLSRHFNVELITNGTEKNDWIEADGYHVPVWHLGELLPRAMAARFDVVVFFTKPAAWPRLQMLFANLVSRGTPLVDATVDRAWHSAISEVIAGPVRITDLAGWLMDTVLPKRKAISSALSESSLARRFQLPLALHALRSEIQRPVPRAKATKPAVLFIPTNGVGLGHAKRCSLIADAMRKDCTSQFAAFPSCIGMLTASGFDTMPLVSRTAQRESHANDIINFSRLSAGAENAAATVFDGGYVFDSVMRAAADHGRPSVWIRRGLWQASQSNQVALDRQKTFTRIVVPTEAFDELNAPIENIEKTVQVGPIVQQITMAPAQRETLRNKLQDELGLHGKSIVVTMLGGGVAADRRAQINTICSHLEGRKDVIHILVVWPTATTDPGWFHYENTRVVQSVHASALIPLADLFVSAIGYNSFHEAIYGQVPTIFVPQMASFMDDQRARGRAAADRDVAVLIEPWELLSLTLAIDECLEGRGALLRENLRGLNLPEPGISAAAEHILEVIA